MGVVTNSLVAVTISTSSPAPGCFTAGERLGLDGGVITSRMNWRARGSGSGPRRRTARWQAHIVVHVERGLPRSGHKLAWLRRANSTAIGPADADGELCPTRSQIEWQQVWSGSNSKAVDGRDSVVMVVIQWQSRGRLHSVSEHGFEQRNRGMARWVRSAKRQGWSSNCIRLPRSREKRLSM